MLSKKELYNILPKDLIFILYNAFEPSVYNKILNSFRIKRPTTFRVNLLKSTRNEIIDILKKGSDKFKEYPLIRDSFIFNENIDKKILNESIVKEGKIYLQSLSSMLPVLILKPNIGEKILDLAAAPGSKTSQIASMTDNLAIIDSVEPNYIRFERLKHNIELLGVKNINLYNLNGEDFFKLLKERFTKNKNFEIYDKILFDAPCSGEGKVNFLDKNSYKFYKIKNLKKFQKTQINLIEGSFNYLKKGGVLIYSTCTLNPYENEQVIDIFLNKFGKFAQIEKIDSCYYNLPNIIKPIEKFANLDYLMSEFGNLFEEKNFKFEREDDFYTFMENFKIKKSIVFDKINNYHEIEKCLKIIPGDLFEGFFICKIRKI
ncbi:MAG: RsmB/NOP family class I SAM-dependent RNA methyltransferase [Spirochaetes bacterium]|nr:RsmB/NOP family class I SAM-dependent RNA methyltransferase [Spirochaetota bacterium]